ncbi:PRC-barrel domain-containing protein [Halomonas campisalis]|uniref:PRC-barrel domain-containing protein n=1 Tax=Billgrantia campisalis TaxID=74661 RepID=A0ABS9P4D4_9GAMM|nr:PRC-barrel domain-containing protein [Halomonas campisalis]MCG6656635.1 PRC-barrel domain-containing protein [Halomonas campisalis]MDR5861823.1 PRC-barrel domain-containing protein [Halomonas campisalis]
MKMMKPLLLSITLTPALIFAANTALADEHLDDPDHATVHATFLTEQPSGTFHASELIDITVKSTAEDGKVGSVDNLLLNEDGQIIALILSVGGFLGIGEKKVAIEWDSVKLTQEDDDYVVVINTSRDGLRKTEKYEDHEGE